MKKEYKGIIIEESLTDNRLLNDFKILKIKITKENNSLKRWHLYTVLASKKDINKISKYIKRGTWYVHFWKNRKVIAVFRNKIFDFNYDNEKTWKPVLKYGRKLKIPEKQLDFRID